MQRHSLLAFFLPLCGLTAQSIVIPAANAAARGTTQLNTLLRNSGFPRTYMYGLSAAELANVPVGATITGLSFRFQIFASNAASWPTTDITWNDYQIHVGPCVAPATFTGNLLTNFTSTPLQVRSGPMVLPAGTYTNTSPSAPNPNAWGEFYFDFKQTYTYTGGDLGVLLSHPGSTDATTAQYLDSLTASPTTFGAAYTQSVYPASSATAAAATAFCVVRVHHGYGTGCPGSNGGTPVLVENQDTSGGLGGTILLAVNNGPAAGLSAAVIGTGRISVSLGNGCSLWTTPLVTLTVPLNALGRGVQSLSVPPGVFGTFNAQFAVIDAGASGGFTTTNAVEPSAR